MSTAGTPASRAPWVRGNMSKETYIYVQRPTKETYFATEGRCRSARQGLAALATEETYLAEETYISTKEANSDLFCYRRQV